MVATLPRLAWRTAPVLLLGPALLLGGCNMVVLDPSGDVARQQGNLVMMSTALMLVIVVPVMALIAFFAWHYRSANQEATYEPDWDHSTQLELVIWAAPLVIIICLGALTWTGTHLLDPYRPLTRVADGQPIKPGVKPLEVQVIALDWKWLFIYPEQGIATVNEFAAPTGRPVHFTISASSVMNSFYIPALAGQIYAMPGMQTRLNAVFDKAGAFDGFSANYSGAGFSGMRFKAHSLSDGDFAKWVSAAKASTARLDRMTYLKLERPSEKVPVIRYAAVDGGLFDAVVNLCVEPGKMCARDMMAIDARGGLGKAGIHNVQRLSYDKLAARGTLAPALDRRMVAALCAPKTVPHRTDIAQAAPVDLSPLRGAGLARPGHSASPLFVAWASARGDMPQRPKS